MGDALQLHSMSLQTVDLRINWLRPVSARGPTPVQLLLDWYQENEDSYLQSTDQRKELRRLCKQLNGLGVKCDLDDILADFQQLQSVLLDQSMLQKAAFKNLLPFRERLLHLVLITKQEPEQEPQPATGEAQLNSSNLGDRSTYFGWHKPSPSGGPCAMEIMVTWLQANYGKLSRANKTKRKKLLDEIVREIQVSGHSGCTESKVHSQISHLRLKVKRGKKFSGSFLPYYTRLRDIFSEGRKTSTRENVEQKGDSSSDSEVPDLVQVHEDGDNGFDSAGMDASAAGSANTDLPHDVPSQLSEAAPTIKVEHTGTRRTPIELDKDDDHQCEHEPLAQMHRHRAYLTSPSEVALIASILRERHDLRERGVPQEEIDAYLPLP
ncbi:hypothetical protein PR003_g20730 [Phytophthora rubi]|uniref:Uncharacterized protein n=1 Tax=Phytophthora rubi TaxID=129364 RepID=A0A6A3IWU1_9STRA|nr:hypothetical protein PR002_g23621 [Phytophthora rubi]KAE8983843.1 hypothetical protein PR001_g23342 [Phytophthora rubi]KAE9308478.1 hypothetical protein PR003_g20730 [Phytophthora rubi]